MEKTSKPCRVFFLPRPVPKETHLNVSWVGWLWCWLWWRSRCGGGGRGNWWLVMTTNSITWGSRFRLHLRYGFRSRHHVCFYAKMLGCTVHALNRYSSREKIPFTLGCVNYVQKRKPTLDEWAPKLLQHQVNTRMPINRKEWILVEQFLCVCYSKSLPQHLRMGGISITGNKRAIKSILLWSVTHFGAFCETLRSILLCWNISYISTK